MADRPVALVTGAARRVGRATARRLAQAGCDLVLTYRASDVEAQDARDEFQRLGAHVSLQRLDLDDPADVTRVGDALARGLPRLDILVHNASIYGPTPFPDVTAESAMRFYRVNALAPLLLSRALASRLAEPDRTGAIVAMADMHVLGRPRIGFAEYAMSKAALVEMVRTLARELAPHVRVNAVAPGVVAFPESGYESDPEAQRAYLKRVPLARAGTPEDAAEAVRWLAIDATYITDEVIRPDGGRWLA
jgi:pteridine reductase